MFVVAIKAGAPISDCQERDVTNQMSARGGSVAAKTSTQSLIQKEAPICTTTHFNLSFFEYCVCHGKLCEVSSMDSLWSIASTRYGAR